jgi:hypothetical protein
MGETSRDTQGAQCLRLAPYQRYTYIRRDRGRDGHLDLELPNDVVGVKEEPFKLFFLNKFT